MIAVDKATEENGCLQVLKGSHKMGRINHILSGDQAGADLEHGEEAKKQLETIQKDCPHPKLSLKFVNTNLGVRWVCDECQASVRIPNPKEIEGWVQK